MTPLAPGATIGVVGGGQLGRMMALAAARLGLRAHILTPETDSPAGQCAAGVTIGAYDDPQVLRDFAACVDVVTFEFENVSAAGLDLLERLRPVRPAPSVLRISQDRVLEKQFVQAAGAATAAWRPVESRGQLDDAVAALGLPAVLKTTRLGYDGRGQALLRRPDEVHAAWQSLAPKPLILEQFVDFAAELSVVLARDATGAVAAFDTVENRHRHHILDLTFAPARVAPELAAEAQAVAARIAAHLGLVGLLAVEFFLAADGRLLVNELAPRPHNSGHWTLDACACSQFELHVRAVAGLTLAATTRHSDAAMQNLIGPEGMRAWPAALAGAGLCPHLYGKAEVRPGRKMGHVTALFPLGALPGDCGIAAAFGMVHDMLHAPEAS
jgi:5-(carboxyamino)imidazole ribonucleotide synthase